MERLPSIRELFPEAFPKPPSTEPTGRPAHFKLVPMQYKPIRRHRMSAYQTMYLDKVFQATHFPDKPTRERLAVHLDLTPRKVQIWFQNSRQKLRYID